MTCRFQTITEEPWRGCRCGARVAICTQPDRQHPNTPPLDPAGFHSERAAGPGGEIRTDHTRVNSNYCTARTCRNYTEQQEGT